MAMSGGKDDGSPMMEMNTTPLIDVMLVLLIMFIITIPIQTHAVKVDLPQPNQDQPQNLIDPVSNKLIVTPQGQLTWNDAPIDEVTLAQYLEQTLTIDPTPELHFQPDPMARYEKVDEVLAIIKRSQVQNLGFIGNEQYRSAF